MHALTLADRLRALADDDPEVDLLALDVDGLGEIALRFLPAGGRA